MVKLYIGVEKPVYREMNQCRQIFLMPLLAIFLLLPLFSLGQSSKDVLSPAPIIDITGEIGKRLNASYENRILAQDVDQLVEVFKPQNRTETRQWQTEFWGKWFTSAVLAYQYKPDERLKKVLDYAVSGLLATQTPDGYIGNYDPAHRLEQWDVWGRKYCMLGLLAYHDLTGDKESLRAAARVADNLLDDLNKTDGIIVTKGNYRGMAASSILEPIVLLYTRTKQQKYLDFAKEIVHQWESPEGPRLISKSAIAVAERFPKPKNWYSWEQGQKAYEMMSCYEGLLELYRVTGEETYKKAVENTWQNIYDTEINIAGSGASTEMWFGGKALQAFPVHHYQETCVTVTWIKLSTQLFRLTGDVKYADAIEKAYYNALLGSMSQDGAQWAKYTPLTGQRLPGSEQCGMGLNCCEANGPRGLFLFPFYAVTKREDGLQVNYYVDGKYELLTPQKRAVRMVTSTDYPVNGDIKITVEVKKAEHFSINIRVPEWSKQTVIKVNGKPQDAVHNGEYFTISRIWKRGDKIELGLDMRAKVEKIGNSPQYTAIERGPIVLARDARLAGGAPIGVVLQPIADKDGYIDVHPVETDASPIWMQFTAQFMPESYTEYSANPLTIRLCDYASAGNDKEHPFFQTWMPQLIDKRNNP